MFDPNDPYSGYRPDMDQHDRPPPQMEWHWWVWPCILAGAGIWVLIGLWIFT
jgi:hypothetical protein